MRLRKLLSRLVLAGVVTGLLGFPLTASAGKVHYPRTPVKEVVHEYGNVRLPDPFAWLEDKTDPENEDWFRAQDRWFFDYTGIGKVLEKHSATYLNVTVQMNH